MARKKGKRLSFKAIMKDRFDYDVDELEDYTDEQSPEIMEDLINEGSLKSRVSVMNNVKGSKLIKLKTSSPSLQAASSCGWTPEGGIILTDKKLETVRVKIQEEYCNEDLNDTWAQIENAAGANNQDTVAPNFANTMIMYYQRRATELDENLMMNGDTASLDPNLAFYDGYAKLWGEDGDVNVLYSAETAITSSNGFDIAQAFVAAIPVIVKRHAASVGLEVLVGYETAQAIINQIYNDKDYNAFIPTTETDGSISFVLPTTNVTFRSIQQLDGTDEMFGVCYSYMFYGTDLENDIDGFQFVYNETEEKLRFSVKWRSGVQYVYGEYFTRLRLTPAS
jgi:hypothetical protein